MLHRISATGSIFELNYTNAHALSSYWACVGGEPGAHYLVLAEPRTIKFSLSVDL
jgi:hypothetical protein